MDKQEIRERVWDDLEESGEARFPFPPHGRIPNFAGAAEAADRLAAQPEWIDAETVKANPDAPQLPVRRRALREGKTVYVAVPRLREEKCFLELDPNELDDFDAATTVSGSSKHGVPVDPEEIDGIDLIVSGSVAVCADPRSADESSGESRETGVEPRSTGASSGESRETGVEPRSTVKSSGESRETNSATGSASGGVRIGKGEGYSDLEYAILRDLGVIDDGTPVATTVHERQLVDDDVAAEPHDVPVDLIVTPERAVRADAGEKPAGVDPELLPEERYEEIPVLNRLY